MWRAMMVSVAAVCVAWRGTAWAAVLPRQSGLSLPDLPVATPDSFVWNTDGSYRFAHQGPDQWRVESRDRNGNVEGRYMYRTPEGKVVDIAYDSGRQGYRARGEAIPGGAAPPLEQQGIVVGQINTPYGMLRLKDVEGTRPSGEGVITYSDDDHVAIVTDVQLRPSSNQPQVVYPVVFRPDTSNDIVGPPLINNKPVLPAALPV